MLDEREANGSGSFWYDFVAMRNHRTGPSLNSIRAYDRMRVGRKIPTYCLDCQEENL